MKSPRSRLVALAPLSAIIAVGLCGVQVATSQGVRPTSVTATAAAERDGDSGWGRQAPANDEEVTLTGTDGDSGWGRQAPANDEEVTPTGTDGDSGWGRQAPANDEEVTPTSTDGDSRWG
ncbi:hypothetical protein ABT275_33950, partial [Streptomyces sp. NPDC001185]|uniref:hypothetical protein n=1 Tax=Streptomyces sp. NPDC001185 TaxID=3154380 RepID=UPI00331CE4F3